MCGIDQEQKPLSEAEQEQLDKNMISLDEKPFWKNFWNANAIVLMACAIFFYVLYL